MRTFTIASLCLALLGACDDSTGALDTTGSWSGSTAGTGQLVTMQLEQDGNAIAGEGTITKYEDELRPFSVVGSVIGEEITFHISDSTQRLTCAGVVVTPDEISCALNGSGFEDEVLVLRRR